MLCYSILEKMTYIGYETPCFPCLNGDPDIISNEEEEDGGQLFLINKFIIIFFSKK